MKSDPFTCRQFSQDIITLQAYFIITWRSFFPIVGEGGIKPSFLIAGIQWIKKKLSSGWHYQKITQVGMTCPAEIGMGKTNNGGVFILITCTIFISFFVISPVFMIHGNKIRLRT